MDFEIVTFSQSERELLSRQDSEKTTLENSSDFCNGFPNTTKDLESSVLDHNLQPLDEGKEIGNACEIMEIVEKPPDGNIDHQAEENIAASQVDKKTSDFQQRDPLSENEAITKVTDDRKSGNMKLLPNENITTPEDENKKIPGDPQDKGPLHEDEFQAVTQEVRDSGSLSTESTVYEPKFTTEVDTNSSNCNEENRVMERIRALELRKRKSPEREILDIDNGKKILLMSDISGKDDIKSDDSVRSDKLNLDGKVKDSVKVDEFEQKENEENDDDDDDADDDADDDGAVSSKPKKKHCSGRKKKKYEYQRKKGQLPESLSKQGKSSGKTNKDKPNTMDVDDNKETQKNSEDQPKNENQLQESRKPSSSNNLENTGNDESKNTQEKENMEKKVQLMKSKLENPIPDDEKKGNDQDKQNSKSSGDPKKVND